MLSKSYVTEKYGFAIGDRVVMIGEDPTGYVDAGQSGIVCDLDHSYGSCNVGVELERESIGNHDCNGCCKNRHGRYVPHSSIQLVNIDLGEINSDVDAIGFLF